MVEKGMRMKAVVGVVGALCVLVVMSGCGSKNDETVAKVNGKSVSKAQFSAYLKSKRIPEQPGEKFAAELDRYLERAALADVIAGQKLLDAELIAAEVDEFRKQMLIARYMEAFLRDKVGEDALRNFYATNQERYQAKKVHVAHVLFRTNPKTSETEKQALLTKAQEVYSRAMAGEEFGKLAERHSEDQMSAKKGGDLGWLEEGAVDPVFAGTAFSLKPGELSQPFATPFGFHVVKVLEGPDVVQQPFETVKGDIRYELRERAKEAEYQRLKSLTKIEKRVGS